MTCSQEEATRGTGRVRSAWRSFATFVRKLGAYIRGQFLIRRDLIYEMTSPDQLVPVPAKIDVEIWPVTEDNAARIEDFRTEPGLGPKMARWVREGQYGVYATADSRVVGHVWALPCREQAMLAKRYFRLRPGEALIHFGRVAEAYQGNRILSAMLSTLCPRLLAGGVVRILVDTDVDNIASAKSIEKVGFRFLERAFFLLVRGKLVLRKRLK